MLEQENLLANAAAQFQVVKQLAEEIPQIKALKGRGLMLGLEFDFEVADLRKELLFAHNIFTGAASNKKLLRILPPLNIVEEHFNSFFSVLKAVLEKNTYQ